ncbi:MAG: DUF2062 domain-containing protein [Kiritimatiellales bacterium]|nr:DUF2062 domain-containing protein [Kiritimatiellales bacterium]
MEYFSKKNVRQTYLRLMKHKGSPESVGRGAAIGLLTGFAVPLSFQMLAAFPLAMLFKAAKVPALLFTWVSNPLTIPFIYPFQCYVGSVLLGHSFSYESLREASANLIATPTLANLLGFGGEIVLSFFVGGLVFGSISAMIGYVVIVYLVRSHREKRQLRRDRKAQRLQGA